VSCETVWERLVLQKKRKEKDFFSLHFYESSAVTLETGTSFY
jgi:hypothetical protein